MNKLLKYAAIGILIIALLTVAVYAAGTIYNPVDENVSGTPTTRPTATPTPTPTVTPTSIHLTSNNTAPFYLNDTLTMIATVSPAASGVLVTLYNKGNVVTTEVTNSSGIVVFNRSPTVFYNYSVGFTV